MAVIDRQALRVTIGETVHDLDPALPAVLERVGAGWAIVRLPDGLRRVLWAVRRAAGEPVGDGTGALELEIVVEGWRFEVTIEPSARALLRERARRGAAADRTHAGLLVRAPIPGRIGAVRVVEGQAVEAGEALVTLEAMKMENVVRAPRTGTIGRVAVGAGQTVELGDVLVELA